MNMRTNRKSSKVNPLHTSRTEPSASAKLCTPRHTSSEDAAPPLKSDDEHTTCCQSTLADNTATDGARGEDERSKSDPATFT